MQEWFLRQWQGITPWQVLLWPLSLLFGAVVAARRLAYRFGLLKSFGLGTPVIVVGNLSVGGTGKTPLVIRLAGFLVEQGYNPGIISRGYGGRALTPVEVGPDADPLEVGDEPLLIARRAGCPVWVARDRVAAGRALLEAHPECDVLIADDGLQHYRLKRDVEVVVVESQRRFGNGLMLPAGPLREPARRMARADAVVVNGGGWLKDNSQFSMHLRPVAFYNVAKPERVEPAGHFRGRRLYAVAGIGNPQRFFDTLNELGLFHTPRPFPDHYLFAEADLAIEDAEAILMTEKDAVKCRDIADVRCWALAVDADVEPQLGYRIIHRLRNRHGSKTA